MSSDASAVKTNAFCSSTTSLLATKRACFMKPSLFSCSRNLWSSSASCIKTRFITRASAP
eukprot:4877572-Prymnesium_polylepis.1